MMASAKNSRLSSCTAFGKIMQDILILIPTQQREKGYPQGLLLKLTCM